MTYRSMTAERHKQLFDRFNHLHNVDRLRFDDCIQMCMKEFFYAREATVMRILKKERERREAEEAEAAQKEKE